MQVVKNMYRTTKPEVPCGEFYPEDVLLILEEKCTVFRMEISGSMKVRIMMEITGFTCDVVVWVDNKCLF